MQERERERSKRAPQRCGDAALQGPAPPPPTTLRPLLHLTLLFHLDASGLDEVASPIVDAGGPEPVTLAGDQSDSSVVRSTVATAIRHFGGLDGVVMNAGIGVTGSLAELTDEKWRAALDINLTSAFALTRESMRALQVQGLSLIHI